MLLIMTTYPKFGPRQCPVSLHIQTNSNNYRTNGTLLLNFAEREIGRNILS